MDASQSLSGRPLSHYRIHGTLGAGGMGEVYRATDTRLGRDVALKVLPPEMANDPDRLARFQREARAVAALNHPNVVTLYSVEEDDGIHFITMELIEGQPLDRLICADGLPADRILEIAGALAEALAAAHEKGIVHRDLKPGNVMVTSEGRVKVLDFGLAKDLGVEAASNATLTSVGHTQAGMVMGTPAYMSPEQVSGRPLDHRSDIFSLGVVLHEMATGHRPFEAASSAELVSAILRDHPPAVTDLRPDLPEDLARVIRRCLEKDPRHRLQTARDVSNEFRDMARSASRPLPVSPSAARSTIPDSGTARAEEGFWVAVLPFKYTGPSPDLIALAEALSEEIITGLSRFSYLRVIARSSTARYAGQSVDVRNAGKELNARYVMEATLRQAGSRLRLAVQLLDTASGAHLWAENYERTFTPEAIFELQDDLVPRIVSTVADMNGVLPRSMSEALRTRPAHHLSPYEAVLRSFGYFERVTADELNEAIAAIEGAVQKAPTYADAWALLALLSVQRYAQGFGPAADSLATGAVAARKAVEAAPANHLAWFSLSQVLFFQKDFRTFRNAADRALALNPMDSNSLALHSEMLAYSGDWDRGLALAERARQLNPHHPGWYWHVNFNHAYRQRDYRAALEIASKMNQTSNWGAQVLTAAACGQLGDREAAAQPLRELLQLRPDAAARVSADAEKWFDADYAAHLIEGLRKAGLDILEAGAIVAPRVPAPAMAPGVNRSSGVSRADEGFWVAVLPFRFVGNDPGLTALAEGFTDDIVTNMSKFSYLRVVARSSTAQYAQRAVDVRTAAKELGARYVLEGSIRQAGPKVRIAVQLVDANAGASLWADSYDRNFTPETMLDVLDDVVPRLVATIGDAQGILAHSMTEALRGRDPASLTPYEALLRSFGFHQHVSAEEHFAGITALEHAVKLAPDHAECWAMLSWLYRAEFTHGYHPRPDPMNRSLEAARRAVNLAPSSQLAHAAMASAHFFRRELHEFRAVAERALALNRMQGYTTAFLGLHFAYSGEWERGCALCEHATQLNPNHPGWYWLPLVMNAYRQHDGERALEHALKINMPSLWTAQVALTAVNTQLGRMEQARTALRSLLANRPDFPAQAREHLSIWWLPDLVEQLLGDLRKAGLQIPNQPPTPAEH